jgi:HK97 family phage major capsid protein
MENVEEKSVTMTPDEIKNLIGQAVAEIKATLPTVKIEDNVEKINKMDSEYDGLSDREKMNKAFRKLIPVVKNRNTAETKAFVSEASDGTDLVPTVLNNEVSSLLSTYGVAARDAYNFNMTSQTFKAPKLTTQPTGSWVAESGQKPVYNGAFETVTFTRHEYVLLMTFTNQLIEDSAFDLIGLVSGYASQDMANAEDTALFTGTGSPITGICSGSLVPSVTLASTLANAASGSGLYTKLAEVVGTIQDNAGLNPKWYMNRTTYGLLLGMTTTTGTPYITNDGNTPNLFGYPIETTPVLPATSVTTSGTKYIVFGDMKQGAWVGRRKGLSLAITDTATIGGTSMFEYNATGVRIEDSKDIQIIQPNAFVALKSA